MYTPSPQISFKSNQSSVYLIGLFLQDYKDVFPWDTDSEESERIDCVIVYEGMVQLGFIRKSKALSKTLIKEIGGNHQSLPFNNKHCNSDQALFNHFWYILKSRDKGVVRRENLLVYFLAIQGFSSKELQQNKTLASLYFHVRFHFLTYLL